MAQSLVVDPVQLFTNQHPIVAEDWIQNRDGNSYRDIGQEKETRGFIGDSGAWDGHMDHYAEWINKHPESDTSRWDYDQSKDTYYWDSRRLKEA